MIDFLNTLTLFLILISCQQTSSQNNESSVTSSDDGPLQLNERPIRSTGYTCGLCIVVDEEFSTAYDEADTTVPKISVHRFVQHANWVFRAVDWNTDGNPDNIGLKVQRISDGWKPYDNETKNHYETPKPAIELLKLFSRLDFRNCCLGVGFTNRPFESGLNGISFGASEKLFGGICDHRNPHEDSMASLNVLLISGRGLKGSQISSHEISAALVHELGHSFGVNKHDNELDDTHYQCWGFQDKELPLTFKSRPIDGRYIMWERTARSSTPEIPNKNTLRFSTCSKESVSSILSERKTRQKCFNLDYNPYCGNGIVEGPEMCDCGNEYDCLQQQKCCGSRNSEHPCIMDIKVCTRVWNNTDTENSSRKYRIGWGIIILHVIFLSIAK